MDNKVVSWIGRIIITALILAGIAGLNRFPIGSEPTEGMIRLAWRMIGEKVKICKKNTDEQMRKALKHMRLPQTCQERIVTYQLKVTLDDREVVNKKMIPPGVRNDRPIFVQEDLYLPEKEYLVKIDFLPLTADETDNMGFGELNDEDMALFKESLAKSYHFRLEQNIKVKKGRIIMIELDEDERLFRISGP